MTYGVNWTIEQTFHTELLVILFFQTVLHFLFSTQFTFNYIPTHTLTIKHGYHSFSIHFCGDGTPGTRRCYPSLASSTPSSTFCTWTPSCSSPLHSHSSQHHWLPRNPCAVCNFTPSWQYSCSTLHLGTATEWRLHADMYTTRAFISIFSGTAGLAWHPINSWKRNASTHSS